MAAEVAIADPEAEIEVAEGLEWLGPFSEYLIRDGYRIQLRFFPWMYGLLYTLVTRVAPVRVRGVVQGVNFRPWVFRLACAHALTGWVLNGESGVEIPGHPGIYPTKVLFVMKGCH